GTVPDHFRGQGKAGTVAESGAGSGTAVGCSERGHAGLHRPGPPPAGRAAQDKSRSGGAGTLSGPAGNPGPDPKAGRAERVAGTGTKTISRYRDSDSGGAKQSGPPGPRTDPEKAGPAKGHRGGGSVAPDL